MLRDVLTVAVLKLSYSASHATACMHGAAAAGDALGRHNRIINDGGLTTHTHNKTQRLQ